jgi:hypothetical protein
MGQKYYKGRILCGQRMFPFAVWDGVKDYQSNPPPELLVVEKLDGKVAIA